MNKATLPDPPPIQRIVLAVGLPGAGKSTWFRNRDITPLASDQLRILLADNVDEQGFQQNIFRALKFLLEARLDIGRPATSTRRISRPSSAAIFSLSPSGEVAVPRRCFSMWS